MTYLNLKAKSFTFLFTFIFVLSNLTFAPQVAAGEGEPEPTPISTCVELQAINDNLALDYVLTDDIDCSATADWNAGMGFLQIGSAGTNFTGTFNGNNHVISNLTINRPGTNYVALFSWVAFGGGVSNVTLSNADITGTNFTAVVVSSLAGDVTNVNVEGGTVGGGNYVAGVVGWVNGGTLTHSRSSATISGGNYLGGLGGYNQGTVSDSYSITTVDGTNYPAGVVGNNEGTVENTFSTGALTGTNPGGVVGLNLGTVTNSFYDSETTGATDTGKGTGKTTAEMKTQSTFTGWDFTVAGDGTIGDWIMAGYPHLQNEHRTTITTAVELQLMAVDLDEDYTIANDLDATELTNYTPMGILLTPFTGTLDGGGFLIDNLVINQPSLQSAGIIGVTSVDATIQRVGYNSGSVIGNRFVGGIVGYSEGSIFESFSNVDVTATTPSVSFGEAGGVVGVSIGESAVVQDSYATGNVISSFDVGGLAGYSSGTTVRSYATGNVSGGSNMGGLIGRAEIDDITNNFATGEIGSGAVFDGGLIGALGGGVTFTGNYWNDNGSVDECYTGGDTGCTAIDDDISYFYDPENAPMSTWDFDTVWLSASPLSTPTLLIFGDITAPRITNVTSDKVNGSYTTGEVIDVDVTFSEAVTSTGNVTVTLETGDTDRTCTFTVTNASSGTCNYTVQVGDNSSDLAVTSISGTIADANGNAMSNFTPLINFSTNKALVVDTLAPTTTLSSTTITAGGSSVNDSQTFTVIFDEAVTGFTSSKVLLSRATLSNFTTVDEGLEYSFNVLPTSTGIVTVGLNLDGVEDVVAIQAEGVDQFSFNKLFTTAASGGSGGSGSSSGSSSSGNSNSSKSSSTDAQNSSNANSFSDISGHFAEAAIISLFQMGVVSGKTSENFEPDSFLTRAETAKIALLTFDYPINADLGILAQYSDVSTDDWFAPFVATGTEMGLFGGFDDGSFKPNSNATRAEFLKVMLLAAKHSNEGSADAPFVDVLITDWFKKLVDYAYEKSIIAGKTPTIFGPNDFITRGEMAVITIRLYLLD